MWKQILMNKMRTFFFLKKILLNYIVEYID